MDFTRYGLEICASTLGSVQAAKAGGAVRVELCSALASDGITPSLGFIESAISLCKDDVDIHLLFRCREGNFVYNPQEVDIMRRDIEIWNNLARERDGIVIGALTADGEVDIEACKELISATKCKNITFHRAFDRCKDPFRALETIISLGCNRLLTSGQAPTAQQGIPLLKELIQKAHGRISIMPAGGVSPENATEILNLTHARDIHGSLRSSGSVDTDPQKVASVTQLF